MNAKKFMGRAAGRSLLCSALAMVLMSAHSASAAVADVSVANFVFRPSSVTINEGDQVTWTWSAADGATPHTTTSDTAGLWDSGIHTQPFQFTMSFPSAGNFPYQCTIHAALGMVGTVTVHGAANVAPVITTGPSSQTVTAGANVTFTVAATGTAPLAFQWKKNGADIAGANNATLTLNGVTAADAGGYTVVVSNSAGSATSSVATLTVNAGTAGPTITTQPGSQSVSPGNNVTFTVAATGTAPLSFQWKKNGADIAGANNATLTLNGVTAADAGSYTVVVSNSTGSVTSAAATLTVNSAAAGPVITTQPASQAVSVGANVTFTVVATGAAPLSYQWRFNGTDIAGATGSSLTVSNVQTNEAGDYSVAVSNASGSVTSADAVLSLQSGGGNGRFVKGNYNGLFFDPNGVMQQSSGSFSINTTTKGKFTGTLQNGGTRFPLSGQFDASGKAEKTISRRGTSTLDVILQLDPNDPDKLTGTVSDGTFTANLSGDRAVFDGRHNVAPQAGRYTMSIAGSSDSASMPGGDSFGTVIVDKSGRVRLTGSLADNTRISQSVPISKNGDWPLYIPLYAGKGSVLSWISFASTDTDDLGGDVIWLKPAVRGARFYPDGFTFSTKARGSHYQPLSGSKVLSFADAELALGGGDLAAGIADAITIGSRNHVTNQGHNKLTLTFVPGTGQFSGRMMNPATSKFVSFSGVVLQKENMGLGWFQGNRETGEVTLSGR